VLPAIILATLAWTGAQTSSGASVRQIMETMIDPAAIRIWRSVSVIVTPEGVTEKFPRTDKEWSDLRRDALLLAEGGRLLKQDASERQNRYWQKWSQAVVDAAVVTLKAIDAKSPDEVLAAGEKIYDTCAACHGGYWMMSPP
jgi:hypothetical protein